MFNFIKRLVNTTIKKTGGILVSFCSKGIVKTLRKLPVSFAKSIFKTEILEPSKNNKEPELSFYHAFNVIYNDFYTKLLSKSYLDAIAIISGMCGILSSKLIVGGISSGILGVIRREQKNITPFDVKQCMNDVFSGALSTFVAAYSLNEAMKLYGLSDSDTPSMPMLIVSGVFSECLLYKIKTDYARNLSLIDKEKEEEMQYFLNSMRQGRAPS